MNASSRRRLELAETATRVEFIAWISTVPRVLAGQWRRADSTELLIREYFARPNLAATDSPELPSGF